MAAKPTLGVEVDRMKGVTGAILALALLAALAGCARQPTENAAAAASASPSPGVPGGLPPAMQLVVGTLRLEEGDLAVDAVQAATLLPLWKAYLALSTDSASSAREVEALLAQLQEAMTAEQTDAITAMGLTGEDVTALVADLGLSTAMAEGRSGTSVASGGSSGGGAGDRVFPGGGPGMGEFARGAPPMDGRQMPGAPGGAEGAGDGIQRRAAMQSTLATPLVEALIAVLEAKG